MAREMIDSDTEDYKIVLLIAEKQTIDGQDGMALSMASSAPSLLASELCSMASMQYAQDAVRNNSNDGMARMREAVEHLVETILGAHRKEEEKADEPAATKH
jgi:hypothetical protein